MINTKQKEDNNIGFAGVLELPDDGAATLELYQQQLNLEKRRILIDNDITDAILNSAILPLIDLDNDGTGAPIEIVVNTRGGDVNMGFALISVIERLKTPTTIRVLGQCCSMGSLIAMAHAKNDKVETVCSIYSIGLLHSGTDQVALATHDLQDFTSFTAKYEELVKNYIITHSKIDSAKYNEIYTKQYRLTGQEMFDLGIVSRLE